MIQSTCRQQPSRNRLEAFRPQRIRTPAAVLLTVLCSIVAAAPKQLLWGDTHLHTNYSSDAYISNNLSGDPDTAYRYALGQPVIHPYHRARVQIGTPLDFLAVTDHAELMGVIRYIHEHGVITDGLGVVAKLKAQLAGWTINRAIDRQEGRELFASVIPDPGDPREVAASSNLDQATGALPDMSSVEVDTWRSITAAADKYNDPGVFTALVGWEWSSIPGGANLHRVVLTDSDAATAQKYQPYSLKNSVYPEDLWQWLEQTSAELGVEFIAIPHNSNISKGIMFDDKSLRGEPFSAAYIASRMKWERLAEITQVKGDSETHPSLSPEDEFADFEDYPFYVQNGYTPFQPSAGDFIRPALKRGLSLGRTLGDNPFKFGVVGSTDSHTSLASAEENNFWGKTGTESIPENKQRQANEEFLSASGWDRSASGLAAVWAEANTRGAILAALRRREVYGTTGPRIRLQFFAGTELDDIDIQRADLYQMATAGGVPMGGELAALDRSPTFLLLAGKDPRGANLDRAQIIKGWVDAEGIEHETIFNVAWSDERALDTTGKLPPVGNTVDITRASYVNTIGAPQLNAAWQDPEFDPTQAAFYYARILEIPTPRHSLFDAIALGMQHAGEHPDTIQERAYSSAIWYNP